MLKLPMLAAVAVLMAACTHPSAGSPPQIHLVPAGDTSRVAVIEVTGLSRAEQKALTRASLTTEEWQRVMIVSVRPTGSSSPVSGIAGKYSVDGGSLRFTPLFPFDPGRQYDVRFFGVPGSTALSEPIATTVALPAPPAAAPTFVTAIYPSGDVVPENQLRMYIHFSAPMGRRGGVEQVKLLDERGREVEAPFLPLEAEFWNSDRTRYTVFFDPGRQKRGILPNRAMGPSLVAGRTYTLVVDRNWMDGHGNPLRETFTRRFRVGPPSLSSLDSATWQVRPPAAGTREPLSVTFPAPLDHGLLLTAIGVRRDGEPVTGDVRVEDRETRWTMTPSTAWQPGRYELIALSILEDLAGNRIGRAFEVDGFQRAATPTPEPAATSIPFALVPAHPHIPPGS
jgi:hypothetical protein